MNNIKIQRMFRIQGGKFPNRSRNLIVVSDNKIFCPISKGVHIGDTEHMTYFLFKRLGITEIKDIPKNIEESDVHVIEMFIPYWLKYLIDKYSVDEFQNKNKSYPKLVDKSTPRSILSNIQVLV